MTEDARTDDLQMVFRDALKAWITMLETATPRLEHEKQAALAAALTAGDQVTVIVRRAGADFEVSLALDGKPAETDQPRVIFKLEGKLGSPQAADRDAKFTIN
jgi:hypothetical protein